MVEVSNRVSIWLGVVASPDSINSAAQPTAWGDAMLVPDAVVVPPPMASDTILIPGAMTSVEALLFERPATLSELSTAPTEITLLRQAGEVIWVPELLFPAEAKAITPFARSVLMDAAPA